MENKTAQFHICPARPEAAGLFFTQHTAEDERLGAIGHIRMDFGKSGSEFWRARFPGGQETLCRDLGGCFAHPCTGSTSSTF